MKFNCITNDGSSLEVCRHAINYNFLFDAYSEDGGFIKVRVILTPEKVQEMVEYLQSDIERQTEYTCIYEPTDKMLVDYDEEDIKFYTVDDNVCLSFADARQLALDILSYVNEPPEEVYEYKNEYQCSSKDGSFLSIGYFDRLSFDADDLVYLNEQDAQQLKNDLEHWLNEH